MAKSNSAPVGMSGVMHVLETRILKPAIYFILLGGFVRVAAVAFNSTFPYQDWPLPLQVLIDATVALGTVGVSDIMFNIACSRARRINQEIDALNNSDDYRPNPAWSAKRFQQQAAVLADKLAKAIKGKRRDRLEQVAIAILCGVIMLVFGSAFEAITLNRVSLLGVGIGFVTTFALLPLQYAVFAVYREIRPSISERADSIVDEATEAALEAARLAFQNGTATPEQLDLLDKATTSTFNRGLLRTMRKRDRAHTYLTTSQVYAWYGVTDASGQAQMRKRISDAGDKGLPETSPVIADAATNKWMTPVGALGYLFAPEFIERIKANAERKMQQSQAASIPTFSEQSSSSDRTGSSVEERTPEVVLALDTSPASRGRARRTREPNIVPHLTRMFQEGMRLEAERNREA